MSLICEESHLCFGKEPEPPHQTSHLCFGKRQRPNFEPLEVRAVTAILEDAVHQLAILGKTLPADAAADWNENFIDVETRFGTPPPPSREFPLMAGMWPAATEAMLKVQRDRLFAETILEDVLTELREKGSFSSLRTSLDWQGAMIADEEQLLAKYCKGREWREGLAAQLRIQRRNMSEQQTFWDKKNDLLTSNLHDTYLLGGLAMSYAGAWEHNRREQHILTLSNKESVLHDAIESIQDPDAPNEQRIHTEIIQFLATDTKILKKELDHWTDLYDAEMMERETQNMQLRHALEQQNQEHIELEKEVHHRASIMEDTIDMRAKYQDTQKAITNVIAIQAWWRGVAFRAGIAHKKGTKGKKGKKGKGKTGKKGKKGKGGKSKNIVKHKIGK